MNHQNFVLTCIKKMKSLTERREGRGQKPPGPQEDTSGVPSSPRNADKEIVRESLEKGLPVIPFAQPSLLLPEEEENNAESHLKKLRRRSTDLKKELSDFRFWNKQVYFEEDEDENGTRTQDRSRQQSSSLKVDNFRRHLSTSSPYMDMRPTLVEEPYMRMDEYLGNKRENFKMNNTPPEPASLSRFFKKGNRHKADYVFVDFEKNNYVDMNRISNKKWKSLTHFQLNKNLDSKHEN